MPRNALIFLFLSFLWRDCLSQQYPFINYTSREGLSNNHARFMFQDKRGLLYISTYAGLSIYDGSRFTHFSTENGLTTNVLNDILEMGDDSLWIVPNSPNLYCLVKGKLNKLKDGKNFINHRNIFADKNINILPNVVLDASNGKIAVALQRSMLNPTPWNPFTFWSSG